MCFGSASCEAYRKSAANVERMRLRAGTQRVARSRRFDIVPPPIAFVLFPFNLVVLVIAHRGT